MRLRSKSISNSVKMMGIKIAGLVALQSNKWTLVLLAGLIKSSRLPTIRRSPPVCWNSPGKSPLPFLVSNYILPTYLSALAERRALSAYRLIVRYVLPAPGDAGIELYNLRGALISAVIRHQQSAGPHEIYIDNRIFAPGFYFCRLKAGRVDLSRTVRYVR